LSDIFAQAGLMAREDLASNARFAASFTTPSINGSSFEWRDPAGNTTTAAGSFPANYPNTWLRLQRVGNTFNGYAGYDGKNWTLLASDSISMSNQVYLGYFVSSYSTNQATTARFGFITTVTNAVIAMPVNPHDAMGPTSRTTPIAFSEIMWKPAPRSDGRNLKSPART
jgi:regulation of enolase protein 1 (concanavalin A-like superfamily)